jgi:uncharacterized membrane protein|tara:strand:+ start:35 stop:370 length:336 start_codon:yes stop_codon:yes gene_type:complete
MKYLTLLLLFFTIGSYSQYKDGISVVQFSAEFVKDNEISLKKFNDHNIHLFYLSKNQKHFDSEGIIYLPTVMLFYNGETILKIESGVTLKLPEDTEKQLNNAIDKILEDKF